MGDELWYLVAGYHHDICDYYLTIDILVAYLESPLYIGLELVIKGLFA